MHDLINEVFSYVLQGLATLIGAFALVGVQRLARRFGLQISDRENEMLRAAVRNGIAGAEEWAARELKIRGVQVAGVQKLDRVKNAVTAAFPKLIPADLDRMVDEELAQMPRVGATGDRVVGAPPGV